jgi:hypothetical protein
MTQKNDTKPKELTPNSAFKGSGLKAASACLTAANSGAGMHSLTSHRLTAQYAKKETKALYHITLLAAAEEEGEGEGV